RPTHPRSIFAARCSLYVFRPRLVNGLIDPISADRVAGRIGALYVVVAGELSHRLSRSRHASQMTEVREGRISDINDCLRIRPALGPARPSPVQPFQTTGLEAESPLRLP